MTAHDTTPDLSGSRPVPEGTLSYEEFLEWCDEDTLAEWVQGRVELASPASLRHQGLVKLLLIVLDYWISSRNLGTVLPAPFQMKLPPPISVGREPDLVFVAREHLDRLRETYLDGPADLVIEITSPQSISRDRGQKFVEYEQARIPEYWLLDPERRRAEFYQIGTDGFYRAATVGSDGVYESPMLGSLRLPVDLLWQDPRPSGAGALRALGIQG